MKKKETEELTNSLRYTHGVSCAFYHADVPLTMRKQIQIDWREDKIQVIGMHSTSTNL